MVIGLLNLLINNPSSTFYGIKHVKSLQKDIKRHISKNFSKIHKKSKKFSKNDASRRSFKPTFYQLVALICLEMFLKNISFK
jgi:hypothetical protein